MLSRQFGRRSRITHCPAKLEASGVHVGKHGTLELENAERQHAYDEIHASLHDKGLQLDSTVTQGLSMSDLFQVFCFHLLHCTMLATLSAYILGVFIVLASSSGLARVSHMLPVPKYLEQRLFRYTRKEVTEQTP